MIDRRERKAKNKGNAVLDDFEDGIETEYSHTTKWKINQKLKSAQHCFEFSKTYKNGINFSKKDFEAAGFTVPILFVKQDGLGLNLPFQGFGVNDVEDNVGMDRLLDVVDVETQDAIGMTMREWCRYFNRPKKDRLLNVISLEYSQTKMDKIVKAPDVVLEMDWLESCWPQSCRDISVDNKSYLKSLTYPKVRKYCLMSVKGCYTDFHIDLGGTSVWYHIFKGEKVFWMVPPTAENLRKFEQWSLSTTQSSHFFPDLVEQCQRVHLKQGNTFLIPSGWIHGVYTPVDSLVFGGNFLHSFSIERQLQIWAVEERIKVGPKYRYPFFIEMHWYVLATLVGRANGTSYLCNTGSKKKVKYSSTPAPLSDYEQLGVRLILDWLKSLPHPHGKLTPPSISDPASLISDSEELIGSVPCPPSQNLEPFANPLIEYQKETAISTEHGLNHKLGSVSTERGKSPRPRSPVKAAHRRRKAPQNRGERIMREAEVPLELFAKISQRQGAARTIQRPDRLIEAPSNR